jgi:hypothetical protein
VWLHVERLGHHGEALAVTACQVAEDGELDAEPFASWRLRADWWWTSAVTPTLASHPGVGHVYYPPEPPPEPEPVRSKLARFVLAWFIAR